MRTVVEQEAAAVGRTRSARLSERLAFLGLSEEDRLCLARLRPVLEEHAESFVEEFYSRLLVFEPTRALLRDPEVRERLAGKQHEYLMSLVSPALDDAYAADRVRIGEAHARAGLEPRWYLGAYSLYQRLLIARIQQTYDDDRALAQRIVFALIKVLTLDAELAMEAYFQRREEQIEALGREHAAAEREALTTLVTGLVHQVGTPLNAILGHAEALEGVSRVGRERERLATIRAQVERVLDLLQTLFRIADRRPRPSVPVELRDVLDRTLELATPELESRGVSVQRRLPVRATLLGDADRLQQLFLNLLRNAADAMPGGGTLRVSMSREPRGVRVSVADSGEGIAPEHRDRVFEAFFTTRPAGSGNGLGLMLAKGVVNEHGGDIEIESELGRGTEVSVVLPCEDVQSSLAD